MIKNAILCLCLHLSVCGLQAAPLTNFTLPDINASVIGSGATATNASPRRGQNVAMSDYLGRVTVVYFGKEN